MQRKEQLEETYNLGINAEEGKKRTHIITVEGIIPGFRDNKSFGIHTEKHTVQEIMSICQETIAEAFEQGELDDIIISSWQPKCRTHRIILIDKRKNLNKKYLVKKTSLKAPNHSSYDIALTLHKKLVGGVLS